jgi:hypothetical protein
VSRFADWLDVTLLAGDDGEPIYPATINVTREELVNAIKETRRFCEFVEAQRTQW